MGLVPFVVCALPYLIAFARDQAGPVPATFTVDESLYLGESRALAMNRPADENPWTKQRGKEWDAYRFFGGSMVFAALWDAAGWNATLGLAVAAGLSAALASAAAFLILRALLAGSVAWILAPLVVLGPWDALGELLRLRVDMTRLETFHALARPFTSQWGPCLYLASLACAVRLLRGPSSRTLPAFVVVLAVQFFTFPYAVPLSLFVWTVAALRAPADAGAPAARRLAIVIPWVEVGVLAISTLWLYLPATAEADHEALVRPRLGGGAVLVAGLGAWAWLSRSAVPQALRPFLTSTAAALLLAMLAGLVVPGRLHVPAHVAYLYGVTVGLLAISLLAAEAARLGPSVVRAGAAAVATVVVVLAAVAGVRTVEAHETAHQRRAAWARALDAVPRADAACLLVEGEDLNGPGAWSAFVSPLPVFYSFTSEYSTMPSLEDRRWRRAWYLHFRGLAADEVARQGFAVTDAFPRFFGAHNTVPRSDVLVTMEDLLRRIESRDPAARSFLASMGTILCLDDPRAPTFRRDLLDAALLAVSSGEVADFRWTSYVARAR